MAEGCNLYVSDRDFEQICESRKNDRQPAEVSEGLHAIHEGFVKANPQKITYPLSDPSHPAHSVLSGYVLRNVVGNESVPDSYKRELPEAIALIAGITPDVLGLVRPAVNYGQTTAIDSPGKLGHRTRGAGFAYELLGTAALISNESVAGNTHSPLKIYSTDRVDLGIKLQASYGSVPSTVLSQPKRRTVEADLLIFRPAGLLGLESREIAVDFKHAQGGGTYSGGISQTQMDGVRVALQTGWPHEFHFVTNGTFPPGVKRAIEEANAILRESGCADNLISYHEHVRYGNT